MTISEMCGAVLQEACRLMEADLDRTVSGDTLPKYVDARRLAVQYIRRLGFSNRDIARLSLLKLHGLPMTAEPDEKEVRAKTKAVDKIFRSYNDRCLQSRAFRMMSWQLKQFCDETFSSFESNGKPY